MIKVKIINRKYIIVKFFRFEKMRGANGIVGIKFAIGKYEIRFYKKYKHT